MAASEFVTGVGRLIWMDDSCATKSDGNIVLKTRTDSNVLGTEVWVGLPDSERSVADDGKKDTTEVAANDANVELEVALTDKLTAPPADDVAELTALGGRLSALIMSAACQGSQIWLFNVKDQDHLLCHTIHHCLQMSRWD